MEKVGGAAKVSDAENLADRQLFDSMAGGTQKWTPKIGQRDKCILGSSRQLGSGFVVHAVRRAPVKRLVPSLGVVEGEVLAQ